MIDNIRQGIQRFLNGKMHFVVHRADAFRGFPGSSKIRGTFQAHGKTVQLRPPCILAAAGFHTLFGIFLRNGSNDG